MVPKSIAINLLVSPKRHLDFRKRSKFDFLQLVGTLRAKGKVDTPIEVYALNSGKFYIADGVHRAKAAQLAKLEFIGAIVYSDSKPIGVSIPLNEVDVP